jgi:CarD family transcriptional regulator
VVFLFYGKLRVFYKKAKKVYIYGFVGKRKRRKRMFQKGDYIVYGSSGVCVVEEIGSMDMSGTTKGKLYYTLLPVYSSKSRIYTPIDNTKIVMRKIVSKEEALALIDNIPEIEPLWVNDEKKREDLYRQVIKTGNIVEWIKIIKTLYLRRQSRMADGRKLAMVDERYLKMAEDSLYGELAIVLDMEKDEVEPYIAEHIQTLPKIAN